MLTSAVLCTSIWCGLGQYNVELFPTVIRNTANGFICLFASVAAIVLLFLSHKINWIKQKRNYFKIYYQCKNILIAPQLVYLEENSWNSIGAILCFIFALSSIIVTIVFLPETKGRNLPENLLEVHLHEQEEAAKANKEN